MSCEWYDQSSMKGMKLSVSLPDQDVEYLDALAESGRYPSRSAVLQQAVRLLRTSELGDAYETAWSEWSASGEADAWESATPDGVVG
jgi:putative addiction module CopG family antidote